MWSKFLHFEFIVIYFLSLVPWPHPSVIRLLCSKDNTRLVRKLIQSKWMPILDKYQVKIPLDCPLHPTRDIFGPQQDAKKRNRPSQWTCKLCGKSFFEEKFLDLHFENRHKNLLNKKEDSVCLADFCDIMRCEVFLSQDSSLNNNGDAFAITDIEVWSESTGHSSSLAQASSAYVALMPLRKKSSFFFSKENVAFAQNTRNILPNNKHFCQGKEIPVESDESNEDKSKKSSSNDNIVNKSVCDENATQSNENNNKSNEQFLNIQKMRATCRPEDLLKLKMKCEILIRTCITGLLLEMSDYAFKEMEDELNKAICWYLSCERYWEDGPLEPRAFPWGLILVLIMVLSLGICFCYYIIWILFDSEESIIYSQKIRRSSPRYTHRNIMERKQDEQNMITSMALMSCEQNPIQDHEYSDDVIISAADSNDLAHSEHYIYVTYPPDLKRRLLESYE